MGGGLTHHWMGVISTADRGEESNYTERRMLLAILLRRWSKPQRCATDVIYLQIHG